MNLSQIRSLTSDGKFIMVGLSRSEVMVPNEVMIGAMAVSCYWCATKEIGLDAVWKISWSR